MAAKSMNRIAFAMYPNFGRLLLSSSLEDGDLPPRDTSRSRDAAL